MSELTISQSVLKALLIDASEIAYKRANIKAGLAKSKISRHMASKIYGRSKIDDWIDRGLLKAERETSNKNWVIDVIELEAVSRSADRYSFIKVKG